jgi:hypothetical protein
VPLFECSGFLMNCSATLTDYTISQAHCGEFLTDYNGFLTEYNGWVTERGATLPDRAGPGHTAAGS